MVSTKRAMATDACGALLVHRADSGAHQGGGSLPERMLMTPYSPSQPR